jgi:hypothetical protein
MVQLLYAVYFDIDPVGESSTNSSEHVFEQAAECVARWLTHLSTEQVETSRLQTDGTLELKAYKQGLPRSAAWETIAADHIRVLRVAVTDQDDATGGVFLTRVTLSMESGQSSLRVSMSHDVPTSWLSPIPSADLRQPGVIRSFLDDTRIALRIEQQKQDGQYIQIRSDAEVETLARALEDKTRLPILLIHTRTLQAVASARTTAAKLVGLARTVTLNYSALSKLDQLVPGSAPPYAGARLLWSDRSIQTLTLGSSDVNNSDTDFIRRQLMQRIAPISALTRGTDHAYRRARQAQTSARRDAADARLNDAKSHGDTVDQVNELQATVLELRQENEELMAWVDEAATHTAQFEDLAESIPAMKAQIEQLNVALLAQQQETVVAIAEDPWEHIPPLERGSGPSAQALFSKLDELTSGRLVFTHRSEASWKKIKYPYPDEMGSALVTLARVAMKLYDGSPETMPHLDQWIHQKFGLKIALQDDTIQKTKSLRYFNYDGQRYDRTPHIKVRDAAPKQEVGRIHFALDSEEGRIIVDHVGVKLY